MPRRRRPSSALVFSVESSSRRSCVVAALAFAFASSSQLVRVSCDVVAGGGGGARFSSSIVTHPADDLSLGLLESSSLATEGRRRHRRRCNRGDDDVRGNYDDARGCHGHGASRLLRSDIDRDDPITYRHRDDTPFYRGDGEMSFFDVGRRFAVDRWQSPLEGLAPLPSSSLESRSLPRTSSHPPFDCDSMSHVAIGPGPSHPHEIDVVEELLRRRSSRQQQHSSRSSRTMPRTRRTGTTIVALLAENSTVLILAADTRSTDGSTVADNRCEKLHQISRNVWCAGAGTSADVEALVRRARYTFRRSGRMTIEGHGGVGNAMDDDDDDDGGDYCYGDDRDDSVLGGYDGGGGGPPPPPPASVTAVLHYLRTILRKSRGGLGANLLVGGYDAFSSRAVLAAIHPHGSLDVVPYSALGSGGLAAMGVLESRYPRSSSSSSSSSSCTVAEGMLLAVDAVRAGIENDLGSGSQVDVCVIGRGGVFYRRAVAREEELTWKTKLDGWDDSDDAPDCGTLGGAGDGADGGIPRMSSSRKNDAGGGNDIGVNGFGNVPFAIQSKRVVCGGGSDHHAKRERDRWLDEVMYAE